MSAPFEKVSPLASNGHGAPGRDLTPEAHVTNTMAIDGDDFEKGAAGGAVAALQVVDAVVRTLAAYRVEQGSG